MSGCTAFHDQFCRRRMYQEALKLVSAEPLPLDDAMVVVSD
jgi:hypothetical protein